jgi:hypothetical protein
MSVKKEIQALIDANKGKITAQKALRWTERHPDSSLYRAMDRLGLWNEGEAAEYGRLAAMQGIIRSVKVRMMDANNEPGAGAGVRVAPDRPRSRRRVPQHRGRAVRFESG